MKWYFEPQRLFKNWMKDKNKEGDCAKQTITKYTLEEDWSLWDSSGKSIPEAFTLYAFKNTGEVYLLPKYGDPVRIYLRKEKWPQ